MDTYKFNQEARIEHIIEGPGEDEFQIILN
jgi:Ser-tRNA(Ala) deacylase AlaX